MLCASNGAMATTRESIPILPSGACVNATNAVRQSPNANPQNVPCCNGHSPTPAVCFLFPPANPCEESVNRCRLRLHFAHPLQSIDVAGLFQVFVRLSTKAVGFARIRRRIRSLNHRQAHPANPCRSSTNRTQRTPTINNCHEVTPPTSKPFNHTDQASFLRGEGKRSEWRILTMGGL